MGSPTAINAAASDVNTILKGVVVTAGVPAIQAIATAEVPFLALPVVSTIFGWVVSYVCGQLYSILAQAATDGIIDLQISSEKSTVNQDMATLKTAQAAGDPAATAAANAAVDAAFKNLVSYDGAATP